MHRKQMKWMIVPMIVMLICVMLFGHMTVFAVETKVKVTYDLNGAGRKELTETGVTIYDKIIVTTTRKNDYTITCNSCPAHWKNYSLQGWKLSGSSDGTIYNDGDKYNLQEDTTFVAVWKEETLVPSDYQQQLRVYPSSDILLYDTSNTELAGIKNGTPYVKDSGLQTVELVTGEGYTDFFIPYDMQCRIKIVVPTGENYGTISYTVATVDAQTKEIYEARKHSLQSNSSYSTTSIYEGEVYKTDVQGNRIAKITKDGDEVLMTFPLGDANHDNRVDSRDATNVMQYYTSLIPDINGTSADVDANRIINSKDATLILQHYTGLITHFPAEEQLQ